MITVCTPTYNRAYILPKLYESLLNQTNKFFEWIIVDDGSNDNTEQLCNTWIKSCKEFKITYIKQKNQGKHIAINIGVKNAKGEQPYEKTTCFFNLRVSDLRLCVCRRIRRAEDNYR